MGNMGSDEDVDALAEQVSEHPSLAVWRTRLARQTHNVALHHAPQVGKSLNVREDKKGLHLLAEWIQRGKAKNILVLCGAGVSVSAGKFSSAPDYIISFWFWSQVLSQEFLTSERRGLAYMTTCRSTICHFQKRYLTLASIGNSLKPSARWHKNYGLG